LPDHMNNTWEAFGWQHEEVPEDPFDPEENV